MTQDLTEKYFEMLLNDSGISKRMRKRVQFRLEQYRFERDHISNSKSIAERLSMAADEIDRFAIPAQQVMDDAQAISWSEMFPPTNNPTINGWLGLAEPQLGLAVADYLRSAAADVAKRQKETKWLAINPLASRIAGVVNDE